MSIGISLGIGPTILPSLSGGSSPPAATGAISTDLGVTWAYNQPRPSWVTALQAPSGAYPKIVAAWSISSYWAEGVTSGLDTSPLFIQDSVNWGHFNPATDVVNGSGLGSPISGGNGDDGEPVLGSLYSAQLAGGFTLVRTIFGPNLNSGGDTIDIFLGISWYDTPVFSTYYFSSPILNYGATVPSFPPGLSGDNGSTTTSVPFITTPGTHKNAYLFSPAHCALSVDGGANLTAATIYATPPNFIALQAGNQLGGELTPPAAATQRSFVTTDAFYAPQPSADLPTLSGP